MIKQIILSISNWLSARQEEKKQARLAEKARATAILQEQRAKQERQEQDLLEREKRSEQLKENVLETIQAGYIPDIEWNGTLPFKFSKTEKLIWAFGDVDYYETKVKRQTVGRSAGASFRVMKGVSIRTGGSLGTPIESDEIVYRGNGPMAITNKYLYFRGERIFRIPFSKIVSTEPINASQLTITRDRASALPEYFEIHGLVLGDFSLDASFVCDLIHAIEESDITAKSDLRDPCQFPILIDGISDNNEDAFLLDETEEDTL